MKKYFKIMGMTLISFPFIVLIMDLILFSIIKDIQIEKENVLIKEIMLSIIFLCILTDFYRLYLQNIKEKILLFPFCFSSHKPLALGTALFYFCTMTAFVVGYLFPHIMALRDIPSPIFASTMLMSMGSLASHFYMWLFSSKTQKYSIEKYKGKILSIGVDKKTLINKLYFKNFENEIFLDIEGNYYIKNKEINSNNKSIYEKEFGKSLDKFNKRETEILYSKI